MTNTISTLFLCCTIISTSFATTKDSLLDARIDNALQNALLWLTSDIDHFRPETYIVYRFLERKFNAPPAHNHEEYMEHAKKNEKRYHNIFPFLRLMQPQPPLTEEKMSTIKNERDKLLAAAVWSDVFELRPDYLEDIKYHLTLDGYYMTHAYFYLQFLREHQHPICETAEFKTIEQESIRLLKKYIEDHPYPGDITIESLCFLAYTGQGEGYVTEKMIEKVLDAQLESGAWYFSDQKQIEEQHTVILAMWLLYEYRYPNAPRIPWLQLSNK